MLQALVAMTSCIAVIPARAGSKGIKEKNIVELGGKPLIAWSIESAIAANKFERIIISTNDLKVEAVCREYDVEIIKRPSKLCGDTIPMDPVLTHVLEFTGITKGVCALLQPTSPLRTSKHIKEALDIYNKSLANALISVEEIKNSFLKSFFIKEGNLIPVSSDQYHFMRRQDLPKTYKSNGAIYLVDISKFMKLKTFYLPDTIPYPMDSLSSIDIDDESDLDKIRCFLNEKD